MYRLNLQLFAENEQGETEVEENKTYTQEELQDILQKETDKRVSNAIKKREEVLREEMRLTIEQEKKEAERLAKLSSEEKEKEIIERTRKDIEQRELALKHKELLSDTKDMLYEEKIPVTFADMLIKENAETTLETIKKFKIEWQEALEDSVNERLKGKTPSKGTKDTTEKNPFSKEHFNLTEQGRLYQENQAEAERLKALAKN